jgi:acetolactate synthase-1/2/3 large subunit
MVRQWQGIFYEKRYSATTLNRQTDYVALARAFGADGAVASNLEELDVLLQTQRLAQGPFLIDCRIDRDEKVFPMIPPGGSITDIQTGSEDAYA